MDFTTIAIAILICLLIYLIWKYATTSSTNIVTLQTAKTVAAFPSSQLPKSANSNLAFSSWIYINQWRPTDLKPILVSKNKTLSLNMNSTTNDLIVKVKENKSGNVFKTITVNNIPIQTWVNIIVSINQRTVDVYINGKLVKTAIMNSTFSGLSNTDTINVGGPKSFDGYISQVEYFPVPVGPQQAWDIYSAGYGVSPTSSLFNKYQIKFSFIKDNQEVSTVNI